ncbi:MAG TPA: pirin family protein [Polyangiaceae bacterium]|nr:pirin family protein [Polyangiaceae bacterium]
MSNPFAVGVSECLDHPSQAIEIVVVARSRDLGGFSVRRSLPAARRRLVGPFIFFDHLGPMRFDPGHGIDVRPHPHIGLATVTYLFQGELFHRDTLGSARSIRPGDVNWMTAGRGIAHSERTSPEVRAAGHDYHGIQAWVALPHDAEETEPSFVHHPRATLPSFEKDGAAVRVIAGAAYGARSPVETTWPTLYVDAKLDAGATLELPDGAEERAVYVATGSMECEGGVFGPGDMVVFVPDARVSVRAASATQLLVIGGAAMDGPRHIEWNFVSSSAERIARAKDDWKHRRFPKIPGDDVEFIPLPE